MNERTTDRIWVCEICDQTLVWLKGSSIPKLPPDYLETCKLRKHMVDMECIAFRDLRRARTLLRDEKVGAARRS
jgi:hypothetical protein